MTTGDFYTGSTSGSFGTNKAVKKQRKEIKEQKEDLQNVLLPSFSKLIEDIDAEIKDKSDITKFMTGAYVTDDEVRFELAARRRYIDLLNGLKMRYLSAAKGVNSER